MKGKEVTEGNVERSEGGFKFRRGKIERTIDKTVYGGKWGGRNGRKESSMSDKMKYKGKI